MKHPLATFLLLSLTTHAFAQDILIAVEKDNKWEYVNLTETFVIPAKYDDAWPFYNDKAAVVEGTTSGLINTKGEWIFKSQSGGAIKGDLTNKRFVCSTNKGKWGATDLKGKTVVDFTHDAMSSFQYGMAITGMKTSNADLVRINVVDTLGKQIISNDNMYLSLGSITEGKKIREGYVSVLVDGDYNKVLTASEWNIDGRTLYYGLLDVRSKRLVNMKIPTLLEEVSEGRLNLVVDGISYSWSIPLPAEPTTKDAKFNFLSSNIGKFSGGVASVWKDDKWAFVDKDGSLITETNLPVKEYAIWHGYSGGLVSYKKNDGTWIYADLNGTQRISIKADAVSPFLLGAAEVMVDKKFGLIQKDGSWAIKPSYQSIRY